MISSEISVLACLFLLPKVNLVLIWDKQYTYIYHIKKENANGGNTPQRGGLKSSYSDWITQSLFVWCLGMAPTESKPTAKSSSL